MSQEMTRLIFFNRLLHFMVPLFSCNLKKIENIEEISHLSYRPEEVLVKTVNLEPSTFFHELISNGKAWSSEKAVVPFKVNGIIRELHIQNGQKVNAGDLLAVIEDFEFRSKHPQANQGLEKAEIGFKDDLLSTYSTYDTINIFLNLIVTMLIIQ